MKRRNFIKTTIAGSAALTGLASGAKLLTSCDSLGTKLRDNFWLWGQDIGSHHVRSPEAGYRLPGKNTLEPREGADFFGLDKIQRVTMSIGPFPPWDEEAEKIKDIKEVVWSAIGAGGVGDWSDGDFSYIDEVLRMAEIYPNVSGAVLDDFFRGREVPGESVGKHSLESIQSMRDRLHNFHKRRLDLWLVWYTYQLDFNVDGYIPLFDVLTLWTWEGRHLQELDANIRKFVNKSPGQRRFCGVYLWNYGERKPLTIDQMKHQLDRCYYWLKKGDIEGLVFCSNATVPDTGVGEDVYVDDYKTLLECVDYTRKWIADVGEEKV